MPGWDVWLVTSDGGWCLCGVRRRLSDRSCGCGVSLCSRVRQSERHTREQSDTPSVRAWVSVLAPYV